MMWKKVTRDDVDFMVSRNEFSDRIVYEAWEVSGDIAPTEPSFISHQIHGHTCKHEGRTWGDLATRALPQNIAVVTPRSDERRVAESKFHLDNCNLAYELIRAAFKVEREAVPDAGSYLIRRRKGEVSTEESPPEKEGRSVIDDGDKTGNEIKDILSVMPFDKLKKFAEANGVMVKPTDTSGLLKMRVGNAWRHKLKKGEAIVKV